MAATSLGGSTSRTRHSVIQNVECGKQKGCEEEEGSPELVGTWEPGVNRGAGGRRVEEGGGGGVALGGELLVALPDGGHSHPRYPGEGAALRQDLHVDGGPGEEEDAGEQHEESGDGQTHRPADAALHVDDDGGGDHDRGREGHVVEVDEAVDAPLPRGRTRVELVRPKGQVTGTDPSGTDHHEPQPREEEGQLPWRRPPAGTGGAAAARGVEGSHGGGKGQHRHALGRTTKVGALIIHRKFRMGDGDGL